jgi:hypothetical protein
MESIAKYWGYLRIRECFTEYRCTLGYGNVFPFTRLPLYVGIHSRTWRGITVYGNASPNLGGTPDYGSALPNIGVPLHTGMHSDLRGIPMGTPRHGMHFAVVIPAQPRPARHESEGIRYGGLAPHRPPLSAE